MVPATGSYTTRITWPDNSPLTDLYGVDMGDTILGSGNPGDDGVQYGLHLAVTSKAHDGSWGMISVWNSPTLLSLKMNVNRSTAPPGTVLRYTLLVRNQSPTAQSIAIDDPVPPNTTAAQTLYFNRSTNSFHIAAKVPPFATIPFVVSVRVNPGTPNGTVITNTATSSDGALGDQATAVTTVQKR